MAYGSTSSVIELDADWIFLKHTCKLPVFSVIKTVYQEKEENFIFRTILNESVILRK